MCKISFTFQIYAYLVWDVKIVLKIYKALLDNKMKYKEDTWYSNTKFKYYHRSTCKKYWHNVCVKVITLSA